MPVKDRSSGQHIRAIVCGLLVQLLTVALPVAARGEGINGFLEYTYMNSDSTLKDSTASESKSSSSGLLQRYNLSLDRTLYPSLRFTAGGNVELNKADTENSSGIGSSTMTSSGTKLFPYMNLTLNNAFSTAGIGYSRRQEKMETSGAPALTNINDNYNMQLSLRPAGLPTVDMFATRFNTYDGDRQFLNMVNDSLMINARYSLLKNLDVNYQWLYSGLQDKHNNLEVRSLANSARVSYSGRFFDNRVSVYSSYNIASQQTETEAKGNGEIPNQLLPRRSYFKISETLDDPLKVVFDPNDPDARGGDRLTVSVAGDANVNIGSQPLATGAEDDRPRSLGIEFDSAVRTNVVRVLLNGDPINDLGRDNFYRNFTWEIYHSDDGRNWTKVTGPITVSFDTFIVQQALRYGFQLRFPNVSTRFLRVVTRPLGRTVQAPIGSGLVVTNIPVTKLDAFNFETAGAGVRSAGNLSGHYDLNTRIKLLERPSLYYDFNFTFDHSKSDAASAQRWNMANSLSLSHSFNEKYSVGARVSREDAPDGDGGRAANVYSASFTSRLLPTLSNSVVFSGRNETASGQSTSSYSLFLNNTAELYRGLNVSLNGGAARTFSSIGRQADDLVFLLGASLIPHQAVNINISVSGRKEWQTGGGQPDLEAYKQDNEFSVSLNPVKSIYLFGSLGVTTETERRMVMTRNFGGSWAPFRDGNLLLNIAYNESGTTDESSQETKSLVQSLRWYFRRASYLDVSYLIANSSSLSQNIDTYTLSASLRFTF